MRQAMEAAASLMSPVRLTPSMKKTIAEAEEAIRAMQAASDSPRMKRARDQHQRALHGDYEAMIELIDFIGIEALDDEIRRQIYHLDPRVAADRKFLDRIAKAIRKGLLTRRKPGPHPGVPPDTARLIADVQAAFDSCPVKLQKRYRRQDARERDIESISEHVARGVPPRWRALMYQNAANVLTTRPLVKKTFGLEVVAKAFSRSLRHIRSLKKKGRTGSNP